MTDEELTKTNNEEEPEGNNSSDDRVNGNGDSSQTDDCFGDYSDKVLDKEIAAAFSAEKVNTTIRDKKEQVKNYKTCSIIQAHAACDEYANIANVITTLLGQSALEIQSNIEGYINLGGEVETALSAGIQAVKEAKTKLTAVNEAACKLENCIRDSCNSEQLKILTNGFNELISKGKTDKTFKTHIGDIQAKVNEADNEGLEAFEIGVKVAGIQQFTNLESLKGFGDNLQEGVAVLTGDITENMDYNADKKDEVQEELTTAIQELTTARFQLYLAQLKHKSLINTNEYVEGPYYPVLIDEEGNVVLDDEDNPVPLSLSAICEKVEASFGDCEED